MQEGNGCTFSFSADHDRVVSSADRVYKSTGVSELVSAAPDRMAILGFLFGMRCGLSWNGCGAEEAVRSMGGGRSACQLLSLG